MIRVKICGLTSPEDVRVINEAAPDYCGFVVDYGKSRRSLDGREACRLAESVAEGIRTVAVFVDEPLDTAVSVMRSFDLAQLHGNESEDYIEELRRRTGRQIIRAFIPKSRRDIERACLTKADYILFDAGRGAGATFNWQLLENAEVKRKYFLAGGLCAENLAEAAGLSPYAFDISSGVETNGRKDPVKVRQVTEFAGKN